jgi:hypothetical protein
VLTTHLGIRSRLVAAASLTLALAPLLLPAAAQGAELRFTDRTHDVVKLDLLDESGTVQPDPTTDNADIKSVYIHYRKGHLVLRANFVDLRPARNTVVLFSGLVRTNEKRLYEYDVATSPGHYAGHDELTNARGGRPCRIGHRLDYRKNFARVSIALRCLSNPRWVQVQMGAATLTFDREAVESGNLEPGSVLLHVDDALSDTSDFTDWTPRVRRG